MPQPFPNHLVSIPQSILSFKHYFRVHDQGFGRTALYGVILGVLVAALSTGIQVVESLRDIPKLRARLVEGLEEDLKQVSFKEGKAQIGEQKALIRRQEHERPAAGLLPEWMKLPPLRILVLDTTGGITAWDKAAQAAGCPQPQRVIVFGQKAVADGEVPRGSAQEAGPAQSFPYSDQDALAKVRKLIEDKGARVPEKFTVKSGIVEALARSRVPRAVLVPLGVLELSKLQVLVKDAELVALANLTDQELSPLQALQRARRQNPGMQPPLFLVLVTATGATLKGEYDREPVTLDFEGRGELSPAILARWVAAAAQQGLHDSLMRSVLPVLFSQVLSQCFTFLLLALICSLAGLVVSAALRAGFPYGQLFTMAVYAMTPAWLVLLALVATGALGGWALLCFSDPRVLLMLVAAGQWALAVPIIVGMGYTAMATYRTARELGGTAVAPAPKL